MDPKMWGPSPWTTLHTIIDNNINIPHGYISMLPLPCRFHSLCVCQCKLCVDDKKQLIDKLNKEISDKRNDVKSK